MGRRRMVGVGGGGGGRGGGGVEGGGRGGEEEDGRCRRGSLSHKLYPPAGPSSREQFIRAV